MKVSECVCVCVQAALKAKRHRCYEDVEAVAQDLIQRGITSPPKLAVIGGSNGGLMVSTRSLVWPNLTVWTRGALAQQSLCLAFDESESESESESEQVGNMITRPVSSALFGAAVCQVDRAHTHAWR